jgi:arginine decarboxylase
MKTNEQQAFALSRHYNASQLRLDTWNRLKYATKRLAEKHRTQAPDVELRQAIVAYFRSLEPIESYWAFPGKHVMTQLEDLLADLSAARREIAKLLSGTADPGSP